MQPIELQAHTYEERHGLVPSLTTMVSHCGAWIVDRRSLSATTLELRLEVQLRSVMELYAAMLASGLELTRAGHKAMIDLCTCAKHFGTSIVRVVSIRLELAFLEDVTLYSLLMSQASVA
jgi:hypothetical protein